MNLAHDSPTARPWRTSSDWIAAIAVAALWLLSRPYRGVRHDAVLYLGQALKRLMPERFATDLFLHSPAQDRFSVFSPLLAPLVAGFGVGRVELLLLAGCHLLFLLAAWKLSEDWADRRLRWAMLAFVAAMPHTYGGLGEFSYAEPFLTARSVAEPLALLALWQLWRGRLMLAIGLAALAAAFHPLIVFPVIVIGWILLILRRRSWAWSSVVFAALPLLAGAGVPPFGGLLQTFDPQWLAIVREVNPQVFATYYTRLDWSPLAFDVLVLSLLLRAPRTSARVVQLVQATLIAAVALTAAWVLGADVFRNVLLAQLQLWRVYWPLHLLAVMALPSVLAQCWARGWVGRWLAAAIGVAGIAVGSNWNTGWLCVAWALAALAVQHWKLQVSERVAKGAMLASFAAMVAITAEVVNRTMQAIHAQPDIARDTGPLLVLAGVPLVTMLLVLAFSRLLTAGRRMEYVAGTIAAFAALLAAPMWDQRSDWQLRLESSLQAAQPVFDAQIPVDATVYWDDELVVPWLLARRGEFYAGAQGSGAVFDRDMALEFARRFDLTSGLNVERALCRKNQASTAATASSDARCPASVQFVAAICHAPGHPDYLVFREPMALPPVAQWRETMQRDPWRGRSFHLYSCAQFL